MGTLLKWAIRAFIAYKTTKIVSQAMNRTPSENAKAAVDAAQSVKGTVMTIKSSATSLNPAREQSRADQRAQVPVVRTATTALLGTSGTDALRLGDWTLRQDETGNLTAATDNGEPQIIAHAPNTDNTAGDTDNKSRGKQ